jgi:hypothetical protein
VSILVHTTLEEHLEELCPQCGKMHEAKWELELHETKNQTKRYFKLVCEDCNYVVFKKIDFIAHHLEHIPQ